MHGDNDVFPPSRLSPLHLGKLLLNWNVNCTHVQVFAILFDKTSSHWLQTNCCWETPGKLYAEWQSGSFFLRVSSSPGAASGEVCLSSEIWAGSLNNSPIKRQHLNSLDKEGSDCLSSQRLWETGRSGSAGFQGIGCSFLTDASVYSWLC